MNVNCMTTRVCCPTDEKQLSTIPLIRMYPLCVCHTSSAGEKFNTPLAAKGV